MKYALGNMLNGAGGLNADGLSLDLQFATDKTLTARKGPTPVFTRASTATFVGSDGLIQSAAVNAARFDHDPVTLASRGLLIEESRTNVILQSDNFSSASWTKSSASISSNVSTAPDGSGNADQLTTDSGATQGRVSQIFTLTGSYVSSVFAKANEWGWLCIYPLSASGGVWFDLTNGIIGTQSSGYVGSITSFGNGWYRCAVSFTGVGAANTTARIISTNVNSAFSTGDGTSGIFIWGAQLEAGSFATSYIPTVASSVVRSADVCSITGSDFSGMYNNNQGTMVTVASANGFTSSNNNMAGIDSGGTNVFRLLYRTAQGNRLSASVSGVLSTPASNYNTANVVYKSAITADAAGADYVIDGTQIPETYTGSVLTADNLKFTGISSGTSNTTISSFRYYKKRFPVAKLQALTT
jgi:hypothetical protein